METKVKIAVIRLRGTIGVNPKMKKTFDVMKLQKKNNCVIIPNDKNSIQMIKVIKDFATFGEIDQATFLKLLEHRGRLAGNKPITEQYMKDQLKIDFKKFVEDFFADKIKFKDIPGFKKYFRLHPPEGGFERGGIKLPYSTGGALGYRGKDINKLIARMI